MNSASDEVINNSDRGDMPARRLRTLADDETQSLGNVIYPPAARKQIELNAIERDREWIKRIRTISCQAAAEECRARGNGLLLSIDARGELKAQRVDIEASQIREFVPPYLRRSA